MSFKLLCGFVCTFLFSSSSFAFELRSADIPALVFKQNLSSLIALYGPQIAEADILKTKAVYDTQLKAQARYNLDKAEKESPVFGTDNRSTFYEVGVAQRFPIGVQGAIHFSQEYRSTNSIFATQNSSWDSRVRVEAEVDLLKNRGGKLEKMLTRIAESEKEKVNFQTLQVIENQIAQTYTQYFNWIASKQFYQLSRKFLALSQALSNSISERKKMGLTDDVDWWGTQASVSQQKSDILQAENLRLNLEKQIGFLLQMDSSEGISSKENLNASPQKPFAELFTEALANRKDYLELLKEADLNKIQIQYVKASRLPELDLFSSLELNGLQPEYAKAIEHQWKADGPNWWSGLKLNWNFDQRELKSDQQKAELRKAQLLLRLKEKEKQIELELQEALREYKLQKTQLENAKLVSQAQNSKYAAEIKKMDQARSTLDWTLRYQADYLEAERKRLDHQLRLKLAEVDLIRKSRGWLPKL